VLIQNSIDEADKENLGDLFLDLDGIEEITQAFLHEKRAFGEGSGNTCNLGNTAQPSLHL